MVNLTCSADLPPLECFQASIIHRILPGLCFLPQVREDHHLLQKELKQSVYVTCVSTAYICLRNGSRQDGSQGCRSTGHSCHLGLRGFWAGLCHGLQCGVLCTSPTCSTGSYTPVCAAGSYVSWLTGCRVILKSDCDKTLENVSIGQDWKTPWSLSCFYICHIVLLNCSTHQVSDCFQKKRVFCKSKTSITALKISQKVYWWSVQLLNTKSPHVLLSPAISKA